MLTLSLAAVFVAFCAIMAAVLASCFRARRLAQSAACQDEATLRQQDRRIATVLFASIIGGAGLALLTGYLVFVRAWEGVYF